MKAVAAAVLGVVLVAGSEMTGSARHALTVPASPVRLAPHAGTLPVHGAVPALTPVELTKVVQKYCVVCHNDRMLTGNQTFEHLKVEDLASAGESAEKMIVKLRAGMMPPPGAPRPGGDTLLQLTTTLEQQMDKLAATNPNPGSRPFQRLNRAEYAASVKDLLNLDIDAGEYLPLDTKSQNFDNIADVQMLSATMMDAYLRAADDISRLAVGVPDAGSNSVTYTNSGYTSQWDRVAGAPYGTRGGISVEHTFPADGDYQIDLWFEHTTTGEFTGGVTPGEQVEVSIDGERRALLEVDRFMHVHDPNGMKLSMDPIHITAGPHRVSAAFLREFEGPIEDILSPHDWSLADRKIGSGGGYGITVLAHIKDLVIVGPAKATGVSDTPSREAIFICHPTEPSKQRDCAQQIVTRLASKAFRRQVDPAELQDLMKFYDETAPTAGFETAIRTTLKAILASPDFVFRIERAPGQVTAGKSYRITDEDLASRLSFFLWGAPPDQQLMDLAKAGKLHNQTTLVAQAKRMLTDPRSNALGSRFAAQWLRLDDMEKVNPDRLMFPDYHQQLADAMRHETELFFDNLVHEDRSVFELYNADYTFVNEELAKHYGIPNVAGDYFRKVQYPAGMPRRGLFGQASILVLTSHANRTSPVLRGKWVMEVLMGTPPPPPPPGVPPLEQTAEAANGHELTTRERMEMHRASPVCRSCHLFIDPIGLSLDNFDVTGKWRIRENGQPLDTRGEFYDGTPISSPAELQEALLKRPIPLVRTFTSNLMRYALGRRLEYYDQPAVRKIVAGAEANGYKMSSFILGVIQSDEFQMKQPVAATQND